jgi:D-arabinose 1-dehydrogenase-like Zn-dependent alcohol dehydrogenase
MRSVRIVKTKNPVVIEDIPVPKPKNFQVIVRVKASRFCHRDLHLWEKGYGCWGKLMKVEEQESNSM